MSDIVQHLVDLTIAISSDIKANIINTLDKLKSDRTIVVVFILLVGWVKFKYYYLNEFRHINLKSL